MGWWPLKWAGSGSTPVPPSRGILPGLLPLPAFPLPCPPLPLLPTCSSLPTSPPLTHLSPQLPNSPSFPGPHRCLQKYLQWARLRKGSPLVWGDGHKKAIWVACAAVAPRAPSRAQWSPSGRTEWLVCQSGGGGVGSTCLSQAPPAPAPGLPVGPPVFPEPVSALQGMGDLLHPKTLSPACRLPMAGCRRTISEHHPSFLPSLLPKSLDTYCVQSTVDQTGQAPALPEHPCRLVETGKTDSRQDIRETDVLCTVKKVMFWKLAG